MNEQTSSPRSDQLHSEQPWYVGDKLQPKMPTTYGPKGLWDYPIKSANQSETNLQNVQVE